MDLPPLPDIDQSAWESLLAATADAGAGFRYVTLATVDGAGQPQARMVVLRQVDIRLRRLDFHTDMRSQKWAELAVNPKATVLGYCPTLRLQLRLTGRVAPTDDTGTRLAWDRLPPWTRATYAGGPPGDEVAFGIMPAPDTSCQGDGLRNFGVLEFRAESLDWFQLQRQDNRRALFTYAPQGCCTASRWIAP